ncbi:hypothetical protein G6F49_002796 [Rhizopus delemar]|uniref:Uncharacterized protein n=1 Tax=Rhizopus oryzae TaxID=64495 RepID=A0A9P6YP63_RHIOR|nr:hypothetical protein G6F51_000616 [Rhizopus arrhizus]KAG1560316.1 hypothetical protein G6F49_002796 [Rhizopus delemar]KAG1592026.1 hypothetical protein G6F48_002920 [Rhizopus delemar]
MVSNKAAGESEKESSTESDTVVTLRQTANLASDDSIFRAAQIDPVQMSDYAIEISNALNSALLSVHELCQKLCSAGFHQNFDLVSHEDAGFMEVTMSLDLMRYPNNPLNKIMLERAAVSYLIIYLVNQLFIANNDAVELGWFEREFYATDRAKFDRIFFKVGSAFGATTGATMAVLRNAPVKQYCISTGLSCGVFGATFFLVRETFISYQRQKNAQFGLKDSQTKDLDALISSAMAGATTGGLLSAAFRGPKAAVSGTVMFGAICTGLQIIYTAGNNWRQEAIINQDKTEHKASTSFLKQFHLPTWFPIHQISEEEYNDLLDTRLKTLEAELAELEQKLSSTKNN